MSQNNQHTESQRVNLIDVSDREDSDDESDSDENDTDNESNLVIDDSVQDDIKKIALNLEVNNELFGNNLEENNITVKKENILNSDNHSSDEDDESDVEDDEDNNENNENNEDNEDNDENDEDNDENGEIKINYKEMKVPELKILCGEKGMTGYKKMRKAELINLLQE